MSLHDAVNAIVTDKVETTFRNVSTLLCEHAFNSLKFEALSSLLTLHVDSSFAIEKMKSLVADQVSNLVATGAICSILKDRAEIDASFQSVTSKLWNYVSHSHFADVEHVVPQPALPPKLPIQETTELELESVTAQLERERSSVLECSVQGGWTLD